MNIQIFGKQKCSETKKAKRFFKERKINFQFIDIVRFGISKGEYQSIKNAVGSMDDLINKKSNEYESQFISHLSSIDDIEEKLLANPAMFITPIVRDGKKVTVGYQPNVWANWIDGN